MSLFRRDGILFVVLVLMALASCRSLSSPEDRTKLQELRVVYGNRFEFELEESLYLSAKSLEDSQPNRDDAIKVYKAFWFEGPTRRNTSYIYLNVYNKKGDFEFQVYWDSTKNDFGFSQRPYY